MDGLRRIACESLDIIRPREKKKIFSTEFRCFEMKLIQKNSIPFENIYIFLSSSWLNYPLIIDTIIYKFCYSYRYDRCERVSWSHKSLIHRGGGEERAPRNYHYYSGGNRLTKGCMYNPLETV